MYILISIMADETAVTTESAPVTDAKEAGQEPKAQDTTQSAEAKADSTVPYSRFKEVNEKYKSVAEENLAMKEKLLKLEAMGDTPPEDASPQEVIEWAKAKVKQESELETLVKTKEEKNYHDQIQADLDQLDQSGKTYDRDALIDFAQEHKITSLAKAFELMEAKKEYEKLLQSTKTNEKAKQAKTSNPKTDFDSRVSKEQLKKETLEQTISRVKAELQSKGIG